MQILFLSVLASNQVIENSRRLNPQFSGYAVQKFSRLFAEGLARNDQKVKVLSTFYQPSVGHFWHHHSESEHGVRYKYVSSLNYAPLRHLWLTVYCFFYVLFFGFFNKKDKVLMCDVLNASSCIGAVTVAKLIGLRCVGVVTDIPGMVPGKSIKEIYDSKHASIRMRYLPKFTHYVLLTQQMNDVVNPQHRPYIIIEGLVDADMQIPIEIDKVDKKVVLYAGGLHEGYGTKLLVEGFLEADVENSELWIFGYGPFAESLQSYEAKDPRVHYFGIRPNKEVVEAEIKATLLVNPRPTHEELTSYSFPSKNMEYMVSGTPLLTTILPGMPLDYHPHVYLFDEGETVHGYANVIRRTLNLPSSELKEKGMEARKWVLTQKNNIIQTKKLIDFLCVEEKH